MSELKFVIKSSTVFSQNIFISIYHIFHSIIFELTDGITIVSRASVIIFSFPSSTDMSLSVTFDHFGHRIFSTALSAVIPMTFVSSTCIMISHSLTQDFFAGDISTTFITCIHRIFSRIIAPIHSKSPTRLSLNFRVSFLLK
jgi:hypothetical protein